MTELIFWAALILLTHTYALYPLLSVLIRRGCVTEPMNDMPSVSILVPAHNEADVIDTKIDNFHALDYPAEKLELVIFDDGSTDNTSDVANSRSSERIHVYAESPRMGKAAAVNRLVDNASHPLLLFTDANVSLHRDAVMQMVHHFADNDVGAVTGEVRLIGSDREFQSGESLYYQLERRIQRAESRVGSVMGVDGGMYVIRRSLFKTLPIDTILDDFLISMNVIRSGHRVVYESLARASETGTLSARQEFNRRTRIAAGAIQLIRRGNVPRWNEPCIWLQFISHKLLRWFSPILLVACLVSSVTLASQGGIITIAMWIQVAFYLAILLTLLIPLLRRTSLGSILFYFGMSQIAIAIGILRGLLNRQPPQWEKVQRLSNDSTGS
ncbi:glycosyltransferase family 2 protein [Stieleria sp. ICT_E10.1]|uniref:glycosyltransferase family 2 protein n=1 Tax=Stieleria sedimenti TaxID=2976331 RepID=UPI0021809498|nr:glycosyltransferase family 2 protein [Stieleria sedimenti]MCS7466754.1 glycosyltransferase family 2 protein [Stieleria sedimenti]